MSLSIEKSTWKRVSLGDVAAVSKEKVDPSNGSVERYIAGEHMDTDDLKIHRWGDAVDDDLGPAFHRRFHPGQVLYGSRRTYLRKVAVADFDGVCANTTFVIESKDRDILLQEFLPFIMAAEPFHAFAVAESRGSVNPYVNWSDIARYGFDLPPLDEQKRIADLLWALERHRLELLGAAGHLRQLELKAIAEAIRPEWPLQRVDELGDVQLGQQRHPKFADGPKMRSYLRVANVGDNELRLDDVARMDFSSRGAEKFRLEIGDILLNEGQSLELVGRCAMFQGEINDCYIQKTLLRFRSGPRLSSDFALAWFRYCFHAGKFATLAKRTTSMAHLTAVRFAAMPMPCPPRDEQEAIVRKAAMIASGLGALKQEITQVQRLRSVILDEVWGGR